MSKNGPRPRCCPPTRTRDGDPTHPLIGAVPLGGKDTMRELLADERATCDPSREETEVGDLLDVVRLSRESTADERPPRESLDVAGGSCETLDVAGGWPMVSIGRTETRGRRYGEGGGLPRKNWRTARKICVHRDEIQR